MTANPKDSFETAYDVISRIADYRQFRRTKDAISKRTKGNETTDGDKENKNSVRHFANANFC